MPNLDYYKTRFSFNKNRDKVWKEIARYLQRYIKKESVILDLGAGYCTFINNINAKEKHALDAYNGFEKYAEKNVKTTVGSCVSLKWFKNNYFDLVFSSNLLEHLSQEEAEQTIKEVYRVLKGGGRFILIQPNFTYAHKNYFDDYTHKTIYTDAGLADLLKNHKFKIVKKEGRFLPFSLNSRLPKSRVLIRMYLRLPYRPLAKQMLVIGEKRD